MSTYRLISTPYLITLSLDLPYPALISDLKKDIEGILITLMEDINPGRGDEMNG